MRESKHHKQYNYYEIEKLKLLFLQGKTDEQIAKELNRPMGSVISRRQRLGLTRTPSNYHTYTPAEIDIIKRTASEITICEAASETGLDYNQVVWMRKKLDIKTTNGKRKKPVQNKRPVPKVYSDEQINNAIDIVLMFWKRRAA